MKIKQFEFNYFGENTFVVYDEQSREAAIIDPGMMNEQERQRLDQFIASENLKVKHLLNTHLHIDHALGNRHVEETYGVETEANAGDSKLGETLQLQADMFHMPVKGLGPVKIGRELHDGDKIQIGGETLEVITTPGHSQGSVCFYCPKWNFLLSGDTLFRGSIGRTDLPGGNHNQLLGSIHDKLLSLPDHTAVHPGHGPQTTIGNERHTNPWFR